MITIHEAQYQFEAMFHTVVPWEPNDKPGYAPTGERYIEFVNDGYAAEGEGPTLYDITLGRQVKGCTIHASYEHAVAQWLKRVTEYATPLLSSNTALYWRCKPEVSFGTIDIEATNGLFRVPTWKVYSRFLISDKPRVENA